MGLVERIKVAEREVIRIDYAGCKQEEMIKLVTQAKEMIREGQQPVRLLCEFNASNWITPQFVKHLEVNYKEVEDLITVNAVIGLSDIQRWILKGINLWTKREILYFESRDAAISFLAE